MSDISPTLNMIDDALGSQGPSSGVTPGGVPIGPNGIPQVNITSPQPSTADQAIKLLQAGIDGKVKAPEKPYETTGKSLILNA